MSYLRSLWPVLVLTVLVIGTHLLGEPARELLRYDRNAVMQGQIWRLLSANLVHSNLWHLLLNLSAVGVLVALYRELLPKKLWWICAGVCALGNLLGVHFFSTLDWYVGLSGALYGVAVFGAAALFRSGERLMGGVILAWIIGRTAYEQVFGASADLATLIEVDVAIDAHLYGIVSGLLCLPLLWQKSATNPQTPTDAATPPRPE